MSRPSQNIADLQLQSEAGPDPVDNLRAAVTVLGSCAREHRARLIDSSRLDEVPLDEAAFFSPVPSQCATQHHFIQRFSLYNF